MRWRAKRSCDCCRGMSLRGLFGAFRCKLRGMCPSCGARRASQTAANLEDRVLRRVALRQWVQIVPYELRLPMVRRPTLLRAVVRILCAEISRLMRQLGQERGVRQGTPGIVSTIQLFTGALNPNPHAHLLVLDGRLGFDPVLFVVKLLDGRAGQWVMRSG